MGRPSPPIPYSPLPFFPFFLSPRPRFSAPCVDSSSDFAYGPFLLLDGGSERTFLEIPDPHHLPSPSLSGGVVSDLAFH